MYDINNPSYNYLLALLRNMKKRGLIEQDEYLQLSWVGEGSGVAKIVLCDNLYGPREDFDYYTQYYTTFSRRQIKTHAANLLRGSGINSMTIGR